MEEIMQKSETVTALSNGEKSTEENANVFRRHVKDDPKKAQLAAQRLWMDGLQHEYPMPYVPYKIGVYIRYYNQTKHKNYLEKHKQAFIDDIALCRKWTLVDFYVDKGMSAPGMESSPEWCRLLADCFAGKIDLIVTQKVSNVSSNPDEISFIAKCLAAQKKPVGIYFISEDIFTTASYYVFDERVNWNPLPEGWEILPDDELDVPMGSEAEEPLLLETFTGMEETAKTEEHDQSVPLNTQEEETKNVTADK